MDLGVSLQDLENIKKSRPEKLRFKYFTQAQMLILTIPTASHERLHIRLYKSITRAIDDMGLEDSWDDTGATEYTTHTSKGEGDSGGKPMDKRPKGSDWPTLVIESGYSQSIGDLRRVMHWWFHTSQHDVKIVLLLKMDRLQGTIYIEKYTETASTHRPGATTTRFASTLQPQCDQRITITRSTTGNPLDRQSYTVVSDVPLRLEFHHLFLRPPQAGEHDIIVDAHALQDCARRTWQAWSD